MARFEQGDEVKLKIGSFERLLTVKGEIEGIGPGIYELLTSKGHIISAHESVLRSKQKELDLVYSDKARELFVRNLFERITGKSGDPGTGPTDLILEFMGI